MNLVESERNYSYCWRREQRIQLTGSVIKLLNVLCYCICTFHIITIALVPDILDELYFISVTVSQNETELINSNI